MENKEEGNNIVFQTFASIFFIRIGQIVSNLIIVFLYSILLKGFLLFFYYYLRYDIILFFVKEMNLPYEENLKIAMTRIGFFYLFSYLYIFFIYRKNIINSLFYTSVFTIHSLLIYITLIAIGMNQSFQLSIIYYYIKYCRIILAAVPIFILVRINLNDRVELANTYCDMALTICLALTV